MSNYGILCIYKIIDRFNFFKLDLIFYNIEKNEKLGLLTESPQRQITCNYSLHLLL